MSRVPSLLQNSGFLKRLSGLPDFVNGRFKSVVRLIDEPLFAVLFTLFVVVVVVVMVVIVLVVLVVLVGFVLAVFEVFGMTLWVSWLVFFVVSLLFLSGL